MDHQATTVQAVLARLASRQHDVVTRAQLLDAGVTTQEIRDRVRSGALLREHRGVYRVGHRAPSVKAGYMAAVLACGTEACLSGRAAAHLLGLLKGEPPPAEVSTGLKRRVCGVKVTRARIDRADRTLHRDAPALLSAARAPVPRAAPRAPAAAPTDPPPPPRPSPPPPPAPPAPIASTAAGPTPASSSSSTATASTTRTTHGSRTGAATARRATAATSFAATRGRTSSSSRTRRSPTSAPSSSTARQRRRRGEKVGPHDYPERATCKCF